MIRLSRHISISCFDAEATVAVARQRPEFLAVARLAADLGRPISSRDVLRELLGPLPEVLGKRVIERCIGLGLLEITDQKNDEAALSEAGRLALEHGEVLVPEEGVWRFYLVDDPLVPTNLEFRPWASEGRVPDRLSMASDPLSQVRSSFSFPFGPEEPDWASTVSWNRLPP